MKSRIPGEISRTWMDVENAVKVTVRIREPFDRVRIELLNWATGEYFEGSILTKILRDIGKELIAAAAVR